MLSELWNHFVETVWCIRTNPDAPNGIIQICDDSFEVSGGFRDWIEVLQTTPDLKFRMDLGRFRVLIETG